MNNSARFVSALIGCGVFSILYACGSDETGQKYLGLDEQPMDGFIVKDNGTVIHANEDVEYCEIGELPGDASETYYVKSIEFGNAPHSHHLIVSAAIPGSPADVNVRKHKVGDSVPCLGADIQFGVDGMIGVGGIQQPYGRVDFPEGLGRKYSGGQRVVFDYHYLNTSQADVPARSAFVFHLTDASKVKQLAKGFGFYNFTIDTPPHQAGSFKAECHFKQDVKVAELTRHTHKWGTDYSIWYSGGEKDQQPIWTSHNWQHEVDYWFPKPILVKAGEGFGFQCDYQNTTERALRFGTNATDEMCILFGLVWDANGAYDTPSQDCQITWVDPQGVGHPPAEAGGFPKATAEDAAICLTSGGSNPSTCLQCQCNSCGTAIIDCVKDTDCNAILQCVKSGTVNSCQSTVDAHSSGVGLIQSVQACVKYACKDACASK